MRASARSAPRCFAHAQLRRPGVFGAARRSPWSTRELLLCGTNVHERCCATFCTTVLLATPRRLPATLSARAPAARAAACSGRKPSRACGTLAPRWHLPHRTTGLAARLACQACAQCRVHACAPWGRAARHCKRFQRRCAAWHRTARVPPPAPLRVRIADGAFTPAPAECTCVASLAGCSHTSRLSARPCPSPVRPAG